MISNTSNLAVLSRKPNGSLVVVDDGGVISVIGREGDDLVRWKGGEKETMIDGDPVLADSVLASLSRRDTRDTRNGHAWGTTAAVSLLLGAVLAITGSWLLQIGPFGTVSTSDVRDQDRVAVERTSETVSAPTPDVRVDVPTPAAPTDPAPQLPEPPRTPEDAAERTPPEQPDLSLPTRLVVDPLPETNTPPEAEGQEVLGLPDAPETDVEQEPVDEPIETSGLESRASATIEQLEDIHESARSSVSEGGLDLADGEIAAMQAAVAVLESGAKLPPEVVAALPHEVAVELRAQGVVMTPEEYQLALLGTGQATGPAFSITRLPSSVVDRHRDADGIPTIPDTNSWAVAGGGVSLPLPGGGDIRQAEDFLSFGLEP